METTTITIPDEVRYHAHLVGPAEAPCPACGAVWTKHTKKKNTWLKRHVKGCEFLVWLDAREAIEKGQP